MIALHVKAHTTKEASTCGSWAPRDVPCESFETAGHLLTHYDVYVIAVDPDTGSGNGPRGIAGVQWGIYYNGKAHTGVDIVSWTPCGDLEWSRDGWPDPNTGNMVTWSYQDNCQMSKPEGSRVQAIAGSFYVYAYGEDAFSVVPVEWGPQGYLLKVSSCKLAEYNLNPSTARGVIVFSSDGSATGFNPCTGTGVLPSLPQPAGVHPATWGKLKSKF